MESEYWLRVDDIERPVTRGGRLSYAWRQGWARVLNGQRTYPAVTKSEAYAESARRKRRAVFVARIEDANKENE